ncbi:hypothetical protein MKK58_06495 [Methylobacterium sp. J-078]|uniref:lipopolysaccharide biosynthesis protein n=1 Tax=Methylobacterium sp. J-078 TaxID=2836657 RepID=UPI001FB86C4D|nr:hypothetical protein [Methylobacterium sp. J-078]MCJ2044181.1 hypothetical protein [Methylobacterium sp. J-078]
MIHLSMVSPARSGFPGTIVRTLAMRLWSDPWIWSAGVQALSSGMSLVVSVVAARLLGVADFGIYALVHAGVALLGVLQYQLVAGPMMIVAGRRTRSADYFGTVARAAIVVSLLVGAAVAIYTAALIERPTGSGAWALPLASLVYAAGYIVHDNAKRLAFARGWSRAGFAYELARHLVFIALLALVWLIYGVDTPILLACGGLSAMLASFPAFLIALRSRTRGSLRRTVGRHHWVLGRWLVLVIFVSAAHEQIVTILAGSLIDQDASAALRAVQVLFGPLLVLMMSLENIVPRQATNRLQAGGRAALARYLLRVLVLMEIPIVAVCLIVGLYGASILGWLMGQGFASFGRVAAIMALGPPVTMCREIGVLYLRTTGNTQGVFFAFLTSAVITVTAIYPLIHTFGLEGAAAAAILGHCVSTAVILFQVWRLRPGLDRPTAASA